MKFLLDTVASKNFIRPRKELKGVRPVDSPFEIHSIHGTTIVTKKCFVSIFNLKATFFILPDFTIFDGIIGADVLTQAGASLCLASGLLKWGQEVEKISFNKCTDVNFTNVELVVVGKKGTDEAGNKNRRLVIDFRKLNERTIPEKYPMPDISMILGNLGKAKFFTTLDLKSGYHQIILAENDREKTSFSVSGGKYEFKRLPFGLRNAASIFQIAIDDILREQIGKTCYVYVDDVIIFSENENAHVKHVDWVLKTISDANMRFSVKKSSFFKKRVNFLGFIVTSDGTTTDPEKVRAIKEFPEPKTVFEVRSFLGLASYYRCFIKDFAAIARPISDILKGENGSVSRYRLRHIQVQFN